MGSPKCPRLSQKPEAKSIERTLPVDHKLPSDKAFPEYRGFDSRARRLGVLPELIEPGRPDQNGRHERMHRTLKAETTRPAPGSLAAQQRRFNAFREEFTT